MKKLLGILVLGLLWCNVVFAASNADIIRKCAEYEYGKKLTNQEYQEIMTPKNLEDKHAFIDYFGECEDKFKSYPIIFKEIYK